MGIRTIPCIFGEEKNQEAMICFMGVFVCKNVFGRKGKCIENIQAVSKTQENLFSSGLEVPGAFYSPDINYEAVTLVLLPPSNGPGWG